MKEKMTMPQGVKETMVDKTGGVIEKAKEKAGELVNKAKETELAEKAKEKLGDLKEGTENLVKKVTSKFPGK